MPTLSMRHQLAIGCLLIALLIATRGHHFVTLKHALPSASWAVFFLAGAYLRPAWTFAALLSLTAALDFAAVTWGGVSNFCTTPAYVGLVPAYAALWFAGRWYRDRHRHALSTVFPLVGAPLVGVVACEIVSSGSFYFYSGRFAEPTIAEFLPRLVTYFPFNLSATAFWIGVAALVHATIASARKSLTDASA